MAEARARISPLIVTTSFPQPTVSMANTIAPSPLAVAVTEVAASVTLALDVSPKGIIVTIVTPTVLVV